MAELQVKHRENSPENVNDRPAVVPRVDVFENEKEILLIADLPGVPKDLLSIHVDGDTLTLEGRHVVRPEGSLLSAEYEARDYRRSFVVPPGIDREKIDAALVAGVLRLRLPKQAALQPRRIAIRSES
jgi:HSP20 family protein